jgi:hypothetical protein
LSKRDKLKAKLQSKSAFQWREVMSLMTQLRWDQLEGSGSRVKFHRNGVLISLHSPHPGNEIKAYARKEMIEILKREGDL